MQTVTERFLRYIAIDTTSQEGASSYPSTPNQLCMGQLLRQELQELGLTDVRMDSHGYVFGTIPANCPGGPVLGLIAHMDTSPAVSGADIRPQTVDYRGGDILLNREQNLVLRAEDCPELNGLVGQRLIVTDGTTLLGADDKAGVAELMCLAERLMEDPSIPHGKICLAFTPDEEVGQGTKYFDVKAFGADAAYTVDGGPLGEIEYENFNAATARVEIHGISVHTGTAKGRMKNALLMAHEFQAMMPQAETPACTAGYEGFYHLCSVQGGVELCKLVYNIREHDSRLFARRKERMVQIADYLNRKYGEHTVELTIEDSYFNMATVMQQHMGLLEKARAAFRAHGVEPVTPPIRGGTDGARLSFMGLPCPNLSTGGYNFHSRYEFIPVESMEKMVDVLTTLVSSFPEAE